MAAIGVYVAFIVGIRCIHLHNRSLCAGKQLVGVGSQRTSPLSSFRTGVNLSLGWVDPVNFSVRKDRSSPVSQAGQADR